MGMMSLRDFAASNGVTIRAVQKHVAKYAEDLEGHITRYGPPRGTYIDEEAQKILSAHLIGDPVAVMDNELTKENERLRSELEAANQRIIALLEERTALTERALQAEATKALAEATQQEQEQRAMEAEERAATAEEAIQKLKGRTLWQRIRRWGE